MGKTRSKKSSGASASAAGDDEIWNVNRILERRKMANGDGFEFLVEWEGNFENTWEPDSNLMSCTKALHEFFDKHKDQADDQPEKEESTSKPKQPTTSTKAKKPKAAPVLAQSGLEQEVESDDDDAKSPEKHKSRSPTRKQSHDGTQSRSPEWMFSDAAGNKKTRNSSSSTPLDEIRSAAGGVKRIKAGKSPGDQVQTTTTRRSRTAKVPVEAPLPPPSRSHKKKKKAPAARAVVSSSNSSVKGHVNVAKLARVLMGTAQTELEQKPLIVNQFTKHPNKGQSFNLRPKPRRDNRANKYEIMDLLKAGRVFEVAECTELHEAILNWLCANEKELRSRGVDDEAVLHISSIISLLEQHELNIYEAAQSSCLTENIIRKWLRIVQTKQTGLAVTQTAPQIEIMDNKRVPVKQQPAAEDEPAVTVQIVKASALKQKSVKKSPR